MVYLAPIVLFVYNRLWHTQKTIESLQNNYLAQDSELFIYSDGPKNDSDFQKVAEVRNYIKKIDGFKKITIIEREQNLGLAKSIISGVSEIIEQYGKVIIFEDDLVSSPSTLNYFNEGLDFYKNNKKIFCITGYNYPSSTMKIPEEYPYEIYLCPRNGSWGWGTWKDRWEKADWIVSDYSSFITNLTMQRMFNYGGEDLTSMLKSQMDGKINSWSIRWCYSMFKNGGYCIYPVESFIDNIGIDGTGVHCGKDETKRFKNNTLNTKVKINFVQDIEIDEEIMQQFRKIFYSPHWFTRFWKRLEMQFKYIQKKKGDLICLKNF